MGGVRSAGYFSVAASPPPRRVAINPGFPFLLSIAIQYTANYRIETRINKGVRRPPEVIN
jgi:hypothetical protein